MANFTTIQVVNAGRSRTIGGTDSLEILQNIIVTDTKGLKSKADNTDDTITVTLADNGGLSQFQVKDLSGANVTTVDSDGNVSIAGNLDVTGTIISRDEERVLVQDNFLDINFGHVSTTALTGGVAVNYKSTAAGTNKSINTASNTVTFSAAAAENEPKLVAATGTAIPANTYAANDIVQVAGTTNAENDGFYVVETNAVAGTIEFKSTATTTPDSINFKPAQVNFTADAQTSGTVTISKVEVTVLQVNTGDGTWETATGDEDTDFSTMSDLGSSTLQEAYNLGNTIGLTNGRNLTVTAPAGAATAAISLGADAASNFTVTAADLTLATATSGELDLTSAGLMDVNAGASLDIDVTGSFDMEATTTFSIDGTGASNVTATSGDLTVSTATSGTLLLASAGEVDITAAANLDVNVTGSIDIDATTAVTIDSSASTISIGADAVAQAIGIGTGGARTITVGGNSATSVALNATAGTNSVDLQVAGASKFAVNGTASSLDAQYSLVYGTLGTAAAPTAASALVLANASGSAIAKGKIVALNASGQLQEADCDSGAAGDSIRCPIGAPLAAIADGQSGAVGIGGLVPVFCAADSDCEAADRGKPVYLTDTGGAVSSTPPSNSGDTVFQVGILQAASSSNLAYILWQPQYIVDIT